MDPPILILDEPAAGLDPRGREEILGGLCEYQKITGKTMIMISHSMEDMAKYSDKVLVIKEAKPYLYGTVDKIFSQAQLLKSAGLSIPQITKLFIELKKRGIDVDESVYNLTKAKDEITLLLTKNLK
jgi:energy-coupling factor transport system ATP-binding protein